MRPTVLRRKIKPAVFFKTHDIFLRKFCRVNGVPVQIGAFIKVHIAIAAVPKFVFFKFGIPSRISDAFDKIMTFILVYLAREVL